MYWSLLSLSALAVLVLTALPVSGISDARATNVAAAVAGGPLAHHASVDPHLAEYLRLHRQWAR